jgi:hypothetical protein
MNAIDFDYPECGAKPGERCHTYTGKWEPAAHAKRKHIAFEEEMRRNTAEEGIEEHATTSKEGTQTGSD